MDELNRIELTREEQLLLDLNRPRWSETGHFLPPVISYDSLLALAAAARLSSGRSFNSLDELEALKKGETATDRRNAGSRILNRRLMSA